MGHRLLALFSRTVFGYVTDDTADMAATVVGELLAIRHVLAVEEVLIPRRVAIR